MEALAPAPAGMELERLFILCPPVYAGCEECSGWTIAR